MNIKKTSWCKLPYKVIHRWIRLLCERERAHAHGNKVNVHLTVFVWCVCALRVQHKENTPWVQFTLSSKELRIELISVCTHLQTWVYWLATVVWENVRSQSENHRWWKEKCKTKYLNQTRRTKILTDTIFMERFMFWPHLIHREYGLFINTVWFVCI